MDVLTKIKQLVLRGRVRFTMKARDEMRADDLVASDVVEAILNAQCIEKTLRSRSPLRRRSEEKLYVIKSFNYRGTLIYTKGKIDQVEGQAYFYIFVSTKISTLGD